MKLISRRLAIASFVCAATFPVLAGAERGTPAEAQVMLKKAVGFYKANGMEKSVTAFGAADGPFRDRDLYVFMIDSEGKTLFHGGNPRLTGKATIDLKDADGKAFVREYLQIGKTTRAGTVNLKFLNPQTKAIEPKVTYVEWVGDVVIGSGAYLP